MPKLTLVRLCVLIISTCMPFFAFGAEQGVLKIKKMGQLSIIETRPQNAYEALPAQSSPDGSLIGLPFSLRTPGQPPLNKSLGYGYIEIYSVETGRLVNTIYQVSFNRYTANPLLFLPDNKNVIVQSKDGLVVCSADGKSKTSPIVMVDQRTVMKFYDYTSMQISKDGKNLLLVTKAINEKEVLIAKVSDLLNVPTTPAELTTDKNVLVTAEVRTRVYGQFIGERSLFTIDLDRTHMTFRHETPEYASEDTSSKSLPDETDKFQVSADGELVVTSGFGARSTINIYGPSAKLVRTLVVNETDAKDLLHPGEELFSAKNFELSADAKTLVVEFQVVGMVERQPLIVEFETETGKILNMQRGDRVGSRVSILSNLKSCKGELTK